MQRELNLNTEQRRAVETIDGPVMVLAGPGTGKTQVLSARIAEILKKTDLQPQNVLALTFTESAAHTMRERLVQLIGPAGMFARISTFHAFCQGVMSEFPEYFPLDREAQALTESERFDIVEKLILELPLEKLKPINQNFLYVKDILKALSDLKREAVSLEKYTTLVNESEKNGDKNSLKQKELGLVYAAYQKELQARNRYDFDDMIGMVLQAFKTQPDLLSEYQERLQYVLVDEYQDTNTAQNAIIFELVSFWGEDANLFVVGDPHQSIYRFQGASTENILTFAEKFPSAAVISLDTGYRCPQQIYDAAHYTMSTAAQQLVTTEASGTLQKVFTAVQTGLKSAAPTANLPGIDVWQASSQIIELVVVAEKIKKLLDSGVSASEIAVLHRTNREAQELAPILAAHEVPFLIEGGRNALTVPLIQQLLQLFTFLLALRRGEGDEQLFTIFSFSWMGCDPLTLFQVMRIANREKKTVTAVLTTEFTALCAKAAELQLTVSADALQKIQEKFVLLQKLSAAEGASTLPEWFSKVITETGYMDFIQKSSADPIIFLALTALFSHLQEMVRSDHLCTLEVFMKKLTVMESHDIILPLQSIAAAQEVVTVSTVHKAKGREWEYVFIIHCSDGLWGNGRSRIMLPLPEGVLQYTKVSEQEKNDDDRRLFYVALTRAKNKVSISFPQTKVSDTKSSPVSASLFVHELQHFLESERVALLEKSEAEVQTIMERLLVPAPKIDRTAQLEAFFTHLVDGFSLSVTALDHYLKDPAYFVYNDLLRLPQAKAPHQAFGTAVHAALEKIYTQVIAGEGVDTIPLAQTVFEDNLRKEILNQAEFERRLSYGKEVIAQYFSEYDVHENNAWQTERKFGGSFSKVYLDDISLTGRIDRFDWIDTEARLVRVVDYKTGAAKSVNEIEGKTQSAGLSEREKELPESIRGVYKRQLVFYKLLTELDQTFKPTVVSGLFDFIEPDKVRGTFVRREFDLTESAVADLKELIRVVMKEIRELRFLESLERK